MGYVSFREDNPLEGKDYTWYISGIFPANWVMDYATYHLSSSKLKNPLNTWRVILGTPKDMGPPYGKLPIPFPYL